MSTTLKVVLGVLVVGVILLISLVGTVIGTNNECVRQEAGIEAQYQQNQNNYSNYFNKLQEMAQVPAMYTADLQKVYRGALEGRYGKDGSKAVVQFITEHNPNVDAAVYRQIQQAIEAGRDSFEQDQKSLLDRKRGYEVMLGSFPSGMVARVLGFPKKDLSKMGIVTNEATEQAFATGKAGPIQLQPKSETTSQ